MDTILSKRVRFGSIFFKTISKSVKLAVPGGACTFINRVNLVSASVHSHKRSSDAVWKAAALKRSEMAVMVRRGEGGLG